MRRRLRLVALSLLTILGLVKATPAAEPEPVDAEMLRDLEVLNSPDYSRDRELARRVPLLERLRMLEKLRTLERAVPTGASVTPPGPAPKEGK